MGSLIGQLLAAGKPVQSPGPPVPMGGSDLVSPGSSPGANTDLTLIKAFKSNGTVFANVSLIARSVAAQQWGLYDAAAPGNRFTTSDQGSDQRRQITTHAALDCLNSPANITVATPRGPRTIPAWTRGLLFTLSQIWLEATGKAYWITDTAEGASPFPLGLWPVRPDRMIPVPDRDRYLAGWLYRSPDGREVVPLRPDEVIFARYPDPEDPYGGCGPVRTVLTDIQAAGYASEWNKNYFVNSAEPGGVIEVPEEMSDEDFDRFTARWRETHRGVARAHRIAVLEAGAKWVPNGHGAKDMDFVNLRDNARDIIREALAMHKVMTGVTDDVNRANAQTGEEVFASWIVAPRLDLWKEVLNTQFLPLFGPTSNGREFDYSYPTPQNREQDNAELAAKAGALSVLVAAGADPGEACTVVGLPQMSFREVATQMPALPPGWVPPAPAGPAARYSAEVVAAAEAILRSAARDDPRAMAVYNQLTGAR